MPYISVQTSAELSTVKAETLKAELGRLITIIPGKTEPDLMVDLAGSRTMYLDGKAAPCAYIDLRVYTKTEPDAKKRFTRETFALIQRELNIPPANQYMTITEFDSWGYDGELHP